MKERDHKWMQLALSQAEIAFQHDEVPVGCIIVEDEKVLASAYNLRESSFDPTAHAEILALRTAAEKKGQWRLSNCTVYVTLEPCPMCAGALLNARIKRLVFGCRDPKAGSCCSLLYLGNDKRFNHRFEIEEGIMSEESAQLLKSFFRLRRGKKRKDGRVVEGA